MHLAMFLLQSQASPDQLQQAQKIAMAMMAILPIVILVGMAIVIVPTWFICKKAGFTPWLSLLVIVPFGGLILLYVLAFSEWKVVPAPAPGWAMQPPYPPQA